MIKTENKYETDEKIRKDVETLAGFIEIFCRNNHEDRDKHPVKAPGKISAYLEGIEIELCDDCSRLLRHSVSKRIICPFNPKPSCKKCTTHCYKKEYREKIREVMRFSGMYLIKKGKLGLLKKYFL